MRRPSTSSYLLMGSDVPPQGVHRRLAGLLDRLPHAPDPVVSRRRASPPDPAPGRGTQARGPATAAGTFSIRSPVARLRLPSAPERMGSPGIAARAGVGPAQPNLRDVLRPSDAVAAHASVPTTALARDTPRIGVTLIAPVAHVERARIARDGDHTSSPIRIDHAAPEQAVRRRPGGFRPCRRRASLRGDRCGRDRLSWASSEAAPDRT